VLLTSTVAVAAAAASTDTAASAAATLQYPGLDSGGLKDASDDSNYCGIVQSGNPSLMPLLGHVRCRMLKKLAKRTS
jgi:hypothetical protein